MDGNGSNSGKEMGVQVKGTLWIKQVGSVLLTYVQM